MTLAALQTRVVPHELARTRGEVRARLRLPCRVARGVQGCHDNFFAFHGVNATLIVRTVA